MSLCFSFPGDGSTHPPALQSVSIPGSVREEFLKPCKRQGRALFCIRVSEHVLQQKLGVDSIRALLPAVSWTTASCLDISVDVHKMFRAGCSHLEEEQALGQGSTRMCLAAKGVNKG